MKGLRSNYLLIFILLIIIGCSPDEEENLSNKKVENKIVVDKTNVKTYEVVRLTSEESLESSYSAKFGDESVKLIRASDTTLIFNIPPVEAGNYILKSELGHLDFTVSETSVTPSLEAYVADIFDNRMTTLENYSPFILKPEEKERSKSFVEASQDLYASLTKEEQRLTILFFAANMQEFFAPEISYFDNRARNKNQQICSKDNFKVYYSCRADLLAYQAKVFAKRSKMFLEMLALAGVSAYLAPASVGLGLAGAGIAVVTAAYLFMTDVLPSFLAFKDELVWFLQANWIFTQALFNTVEGVFISESPTRTNLTPGYRSINSNDKDISAGTKNFITGFENLNKYWGRLAELFGFKKEYVNNWKAANLNKEDIKISNISNENVAYVDHDAETITFRSLSGEKEYFTYTITVNKEGFEHSREINAAVENPAAKWQGSYNYRSATFVVTKLGAIENIWIDIPEAAEMNALLAGLSFDLKLFDQDFKEMWFSSSITNHSSFHRASLTVKFSNKSGERRVSRLIIRIFMDASSDVYHTFTSFGDYYYEDGSSS
jgi:hypothetical protein